MTYLIPSSDGGPPTTLSQLEAGIEATISVQERTIRLTSTTLLLVITVYAVIFFGWIVEFREHGSFPVTEETKPWLIAAGVSLPLAGVLIYVLVSSIIDLRQSRGRLAELAAIKREMSEAERQGIQ